MPKRFALQKHLSEISGKIKIIDVGAMIIEGSNCSYAAISDSSLVIGFEPNKKECEKLNYDSGNNCAYLPYYIGNGETKTFRNCNRAYTSSFFEPNTKLLKKFQNLANLTEVVSREDVGTKRLDDLDEELKGSDYLKIDVQGAEVEVFRGAANLLRNEIVVIQTEVCFVPLYENQYLFAEIDQELRQFGFLFHKFIGIAGRAFKPVFVEGGPSKMLSQMLWADAVYVKDFTKLEDLPVDKLLKMAIILNDVYGSVDLANLALETYDKKTGGSLAETYKATLVDGQGKNEIRGSGTGPSS